MLALGIEYLTGRAVAADRGDRDAPEWPPHPARIFMAMVAAHHEGGGDGEEEMRALTWLESLPPPAIAASAAHVRRGWDRTAPLDAKAIASTEDDVGQHPATIFVPANDRAGPAKGSLQSAPGLARSKGARTFPSVRPLDERVFLVWKEVNADHRRSAIEALCGKVTRIGHSSSLVRMWVEDDPPRATWLPDDEEATIHLRVPTDGYVAALEASYRRDPTRLPSGAAWQGYAPARNDKPRPVHGTVWDPNLAILRIEPLESPFRHLDLVSALGLTAGFHRVMLDLVPDPVPEFVSGHDAGKNPSRHPHVAYLPLGWVGDRYADGLIRGIGVAIPRGLERRERRIIYGALGQLRELRLGRLGRWRVDADDPDAMPVNLQPWTWTGGRSGSRRWGSVTPVAFDRHPKGKEEAYHAAAVTMVRDACINIGLPEPSDVWISPVSVHWGAPAAHEFPHMRRKDGSERRHLHVQLLFEEPVHGPVALGAGRYRGYGLLRPIRERRDPGENR